MEGLCVDTRQDGLVNRRASRGESTGLVRTSENSAMDDEDDQRLLDIIGDVQALNNYLHGCSNKSVDTNDVPNATFGSADSLFANNTGDLDSSLKSYGNCLGVVGEAGGVELNFSSSLQFIEDELVRASPSGAEKGDEQPFDILQKSLLEADITEQTLVQEALLESTPVPTVFPEQVVSGAGFDGVAAGGLPFSGTQPQGFLQQPLQNGSSVGHIQVLGSFNGSPSVVTATGMLVQRPAGQAGGSGQGSVFSPTPGGTQVPVTLSGCGTPIPLQNIIIQRGLPPQALVKPIQPKPLPVGGQTVYSLGVQIPAAAGSPQPTQQVKVVSQSSSIVIQPSLGQQQQASIPTGQFILPTSLSLTPDHSSQSLQALNGPALQTTQPMQPMVTAEDTSTSTTYSILTNHSTSATVQLVAGQGFAAGGHLIVNQGVVSGQVAHGAPTLVQVSGTQVTTPKTWAGLSSSTSASPTPNPVQGTPIQSHFTLVSSTASSSAEYNNQIGGAVSVGLQSQPQVSVNLGQRILVPLVQSSAPSAQTGVSEQHFQTQVFAVAQDSPSAPPRLQLGSMLGDKAVKTLPATSQVEPLYTVTSSLNLHNRPVKQMLTKGDLVFQQLHQDQVKALSANRSPFTSLEDAFLQLLPYHVFQGALPTDDDFAKVDQEFEAVATDVLKRTQAMLSKYRCLLLAEAERTSPSSEIVMIDRTFNQEERRELTQDKRMVLVDPEGFLEDFCCMVKPVETTWVGDAQVPAGCSSDLDIDGCRTEMIQSQQTDVSPPSTAIEITPDMKSCQMPVTVMLKKCSSAVYHGWLFLYLS
ncbi:GLTSCR1-like protein, partial [Arapaima gigas]